MKCPKCNKDVSDYAIKCKYCDTSLIIKSPEISKAQPGYNQKARSSYSRLAYAFIAAIVVIIIAYLVLQPRDKAAPSYPAQTQASSKYASPLAKVWSGVKIYYGSGDNKTYAFEILGGSDDCDSMPSGKGVKVKYPDGSEEWKDRNAIVSSGTFYVISEDPAIKKMEWYVYKTCR